MPHPIYADRQTLWNAVEKAERRQDAQLAYSFDIALQNEFSIEENIALARQFLLEQFVSRGMIVDFAVHQPDKDGGGISNPHFHVMCPIRPLDGNGKWSAKQKQVYRLDENGNRILGRNGKPMTDAVSTTDWGTPETLEAWRAAWTELCNAKFAEKGLDCRIDHRSYAEQNIDLLPTIHEGPTVRAMEKKGIRTEKGELNRWIQSANSLILELKQKIATLVGKINEVKEELAQPQSPNLGALLSAYYTRRNAGAYSQKAKVNNLKEWSETVNYLNTNGIYTLDDLGQRTSAIRETVDTLKAKLDEQSGQEKDLRRTMDSIDTFKQLKPVYDRLQKIKFPKAREKYKVEHAAELKSFYAARRVLSAYPEGQPDVAQLMAELAQLQENHGATYAEFKSIRDDLRRIWKIQSIAESAARQQQEQTLQQPSQEPRAEEDQL